MAVLLRALRRVSALALLLTVVGGGPVWAAADPRPRPVAEEARAHAPESRPGRAGADEGMPGIIPIGLGLLLTGIAVYKHRGLPSSGH